MSKLKDELCNEQAALQGAQLALECSAQEVAGLQAAKQELQTKAVAAQKADESGMQKVGELEGQLERLRALLAAEEEEHSQTQAIVVAEKDSHSQTQAVLATEKEQHIQTQAFLSLSRRSNATRKQRW